MLDEKERQQLIEITKMCGINAARVMSEVSNRKLEVSKVNVNEQNIRDISEYFCSEDKVVYCDYFQITGEISGTMLFIVYENKETGNPDLGIIREEGNRVISSFLETLENNQRLFLNIEFADTIKDYLPAIIETAVTHFVLSSDNMIVMECEYVTPEGEKFHSILYPNQMSLRNYINKL